MADSHTKLMERIAASEAATIAGSGNGATRQDFSTGSVVQPGMAAGGNGASPSTSGGISSGSPGVPGQQMPIGAYPGNPANWYKSASAARKAHQLDVIGPDPISPEPSLEKPMSPDEQWETQNPPKDA